VTIDGEGAQVELNGVYLASAKRHIDMTSRVAHVAPGAHVRQLVRGVARKGGRGVFQGKFLVGREGQKTDAEMAHNALLLEEGAEVFAKPELEMGSYTLQGLPLAPMALCDVWGNRVLVLQTESSRSAEQIARALAVVGGGTVTVRCPVRGRALRQLVIGGTVSKAIAIGEALRHARERGGPRRRPGPGRRRDPAV
jgi:hypothetical protein